MLCLVLVLARHIGNNFTIIGTWCYINLLVIPFKMISNSLITTIACSTQSVGERSVLKGFSVLTGSVSYLA